MDGRFFAPALLTAVAFAIPAGARDLQLSDFLRWETAGTPVVSPDGQTVVYRRTRVEPVADRYDSELWVMNADGSGARLFADAWAASWRTPEELSYLTSDASGTRLVRRRVASAATATDQPEVPIPVQGPMPGSTEWSPDGREFAYLASVPRPSPAWHIDLPARPEGANWKQDPVVVDSLQYRVGQDQYRSSDRHIFLLPAEGGTPRQLTSGRWSVGAFLSGISFGSTLEWTPDGRSLVFEGVPEEAGDELAVAMESRINRIDIETGRITRLTQQPGFWNLPRVSPDGSLIAYAGHSASREAFPVRELRVMAADGSGDRLLWRDTPDRIFAMEWAPDGRSLLVSMNQHGSTHLMRVTLEGQVMPVTRGAFRFHANSFGGGKAFGAMSSTSADFEVASADLSTGQVRLLTRHNRVLDELQLGRVESFWVRSRDGTRVQAWLVYPPNYEAGRRYPLILDIHGGPDAMAGHEFDFRYQDFAARGYLVLYSNPRGSTGYGAAFANAIDGGFPGEKDFQDLDAVVRTVFARNVVEREKVYVMGCSGGGSLAAWMTVRTDYFAASTVMCPVTNWISMLGTSDATSWTFTRFERPYWEDLSRWLAHSPLSFVDKIDTPTLIANGARDGRTPVTQAAELYTALRLRGVPTRMLVFPDEGHGPWRSTPSNLMRLQLYIDDWFRTAGRPAD